MLIEDMHTIIKGKFIKKYWWNIVQTDKGFSVVNTHRKQNMKDRDGREEIVKEFKTSEEANNFLENIGSELE